MPIPTPRHHPYAASSSGAHVTQYGTHPPPRNIARQRWTFGLFKRRASASTRHLSTCPADAIAHRSRTILGDVSIRKVQFVGKLDLVFHSWTDHPVTLHDVSFVPDLGFNLFSFHVVQEKHEITLNKAGAHLLGGRLVFPRRSNGSSLRATRVLPGGHASASTALATFEDLPSHRSNETPSPVKYSSVTSPAAHEKSRMSSSCRASNAGAGIGGKRSSAAWGR